MKKTTFILLLLTLGYIKSFGQNNYSIFNLNQTHAQFKNLKGKVKVIRDYRYKNTSPERGDTLDRPGKLDMYFVTEYNREGNMISYTQYRVNGSIASRKDYSYDKLGRLTQVIDNTPNEKNSSIYRMIISYDSKGKMVKETASSFSGAVSSIKTFGYDTKGRLVNYNILFPYSQERWTNSLQYDTKGRVVRNESRMKNSYHISERKLDDKTGLPEQEIGFEKGIKSSTTDYTYDPFGNMLSQRYSYHGDGGNGGREQYRYEYDTKQNWVIKRSDFYDSDDYHSQAFERREIVYY
ncbi:hypothetical protein ACS5PU_17805 [Pedobacter sp. GSP4]|uniref:hypothetical protein n=1 Tax=Pedobacter sp. GSP4 TaxID=3453716 RepID=UPI003EEE5489